MSRKSIPIAISMAVFAWSAQAATLTNVEGAVSINRGNGDQQGAAGVELNPGDRVKAGKGSADILYANGCSTRVDANHVMVVLATPPACGGGGLKDGVVAVEEPSSLLIGGLIVAGGAGAAIAIANSNNHPASP
ncbi:MAG: hypothetical protein WAK07_20830 [Rhodomicrobium sp.]